MSVPDPRSAVVPPPAGPRPADDWTETDDRRAEDHFAAARVLVGLVGEDDRRPAAVPREAGR